MASPLESRYMTAGERAILVVRRHPIVLAKATSFALLAFFAAILAPSSITSLTSLGFGAYLAWEAVQWWLDRIVLTDQRVFIVSGIVTRRVATMPLRKVTGMTYHRTIWGRLFGYGCVSVESAGQDQGISTINFIPDPDDFYRTLAAYGIATIGPVPAVPEVAELIAHHEHIDLDDGGAEWVDESEEEFPPRDRHPVGRRYRDPREDDDNGDSRDFPIILP